MNEITMTVSQARGLILASAKGDVRYYLNGTLLDFAGGRAIATDGRCLLAVNLASQADDPAFASAIVPRDALENIAKGGKVTDDICITYDDDGLHLMRNSVRITVEPIDGRFPDWQRVIPDDANGEPAQYNPELVARIGKALCLAVNDKKAMPAIAYNGNAAALVVAQDHAETAVAVVMPWRNDCDAAAALADFNAAGRKQAKAA
jgi:DNA polymerase III sliding clamp (beta) subunit (PCNA family)